MNTIEQKQNEVLEQNNTAQTQLLAILDALNPETADEIRFEQPLHGALDFAVLKERHFTEVEHIVFEVSGKVTSLQNIPDKITYIECPNQLINEFTEAPSSLEELDLTGNFLTKFDVPNIPHLRILRISNNELSEMANLPETLETLECENNQLRQLDLTNTRFLKSLHCSNNPLLVIQNLPQTITDYKNENNPFVEIDNEDEPEEEIKRGQKGKGKGKDKDKGKDQGKDQKVEYLESIHEYLKLKNTYENKLHFIKKTNWELNKGEKKRKGDKEKQPPCISCKRPVGTIFKIHGGRYTAVCGDKHKPCNLNIQIFNGDYSNLDNLLNIYSAEIQDTKEQIIIQKMDTLFNYVGEHSAITKFKEKLAEYNSINENHKTTLSWYNDLYANDAKRVKIETEMQKIYQIRGDIELMIDEYKKTGNREILTQAMNMQIDDLIPAIQNIRLLKYDTMMVETDVFEISRLVQREVAAHKQDFIYGEEPRVIKFKL